MLKKFRFTALAALAIASILVAGCATPAVPKSLEQAAFLAKGEYTAAASIVERYVRLPRCADVKTYICSQQSTVDRLKVLDACAYAASLIAENVARGKVGAVPATGCTDPMLGSLLRQAGSAELQGALSIAKEVIGPFKSFADKIRDFVT